MGKRTNDDELYFTAYPSDNSGGWTVWDHINDVQVAVGVPQEEALQLAGQLQAQQR